MNGLQKRAMRSVVAGRLPSCVPCRVSSQCSGTGYSPTRHRGVCRCVSRDVCGVGCILARVSLRAFSLASHRTGRKHKSAQMASDSEDGGLDLFQEPSDFYQPEKEATFESHQLLSGKDLRIRLVGHNPLWVRDAACGAYCCHAAPWAACRRSGRAPMVRNITQLTCLGPSSLERGANYSTLS